MMEKRFCGIISLAAGLLMVAGCAEDDGIGSGRSQRQVPIELTATVKGETGEWGAATRAAINLNNSYLPSGSQFYATFSGYPENVTRSNAVYTIAGNAGAAYIATTEQPCLTISGTSTTVKAFYPSTVTESTTSFTVAADQSTDANYLASDLMYATTTVSTNANRDDAVGNLAFSHKMAKIIVNAYLGDGINSVTGVYIVSGYKTIALSEGNCTLGALSNPLSIVSPITVYSGTYSTLGTPLQCAALIPPQTLSSGTAFLKIVTNAITATYILNADKQFESGKNYVYNICISNATTPEGVTAVDLGLSVKWANMNVGASSATDYGDYFQWGDPVAKTNLPCNWASYKWSNSDGSLFYKYVPTEKYSYWGGSGSPDNELVLASADDAATVNWGTSWRMPTQEEMQELIDGCDKDEYFGDNKYNGLNGILLTSKTDNTKSIFLPAAGYRNNESFTLKDSRGYYWSSMLYSSGQGFARYLRLYSGTLDVPNNGRFLGFTVRPVQCGPPDNVEAVDLGLSVKWANMNVGATTVTGSGNYFQWGDPTNKTNKECSWASYIWSNDDGSELYKYNNADNKVTLEATDDAAYMLWGPQWRMPTASEIQELASLPNEWVDDYMGSGICGRVFTGNGNTLFVPAACYYRWENHTVTETSGGFWSSNINSQNGNTRYLVFNNSVIYINEYFPRSVGFPVRAVQE